MSMWGFDDRGTKIMAALLVTIGIVGAATILGDGISAGKRGERFVTVRGVAEKDVKADLAIWPIRVRVAGNDLAEANRSADEARQKVLGFLKENGIKPEDVASQNQRVEDRQAKDYDQGKAAFRYLVEYTILLRSSDVDQVQKISQMTDKLVAAGVVLSSQGNWERNGPQFVFTQLNVIKPGMLAEATRAAREAAGQFETDSGSFVGPIRRASQGLFTITDRDRTSPGEGNGANAGMSDINKKVRVVVTVDYFLT
ncbi:MAG: SIMPL domain-containing protein [Burkholderiaceae bacterium]|nr:SIMPL domain-containing protein [Burkholderiaceae bacterium]